MPEQELFDLSSNFLRVGMATVQGAQLPTPYGGKQRQVMVDIDLPASLRARSVARGREPGGAGAEPGAPFGHGEDRRPGAALSPQWQPRRGVADRRPPLKTAHGATVLLKDVATVRDGFAPQTSLVRANGRRGVLVTILKSAGASTLDIVHPGQEGHPRPHRHLAARVQARLPLRPVALRARGHRWRPQGSGHRGRSHRAHDPALPRQLAEHAHRHHLHPAVDPRLPHHPRLPRAGR